MKRKLSVLLIAVAALTLLIVPSACFAEEVAAEQIGTCFGAYVCDYQTGEELYAYNADERHEIASMVKIMTANLVLEQLDAGAIKKTDMVEISRTAAGMGGSQMFLDAGERYCVDDLLKGLIVVSANDASVALAELVGGSHEGFVQMMNDRAKEWGMNDTLFCSATGLPSDLEQYSTARDVSVMTRHLMSHDSYYGYGQITYEDYKHPSGRITQFVNTNKLLKGYSGCVGGKTGFTAKAGFCLSACAERNGLRIVATAIGSPDSKTRFNTVAKLFDYAYAHYSMTQICKAGDEIEQKLTVRGGKADEIGVTPAQDLTILCEKNGEKAEIRYELPESVKAPIAKGDKVGDAIVTRKGKEYRIDLVAAQDCAQLSWWDAIKKIASKM